MHGQQNIQKNTASVFRVEELRQILTLKSCFFLRLGIGIYFDMILECYYLQYNVAHRRQYWHNSKIVIWS